MYLSGVQTALSGFPLKTCLHAKVRRFGTQACGNDIVGWVSIFETTSENKTITDHTDVTDVRE